MSDVASANGGDSDDDLALQVCQVIYEDTRSKATGIVESVMSHGQVDRPTAHLVWHRW